MSSLNEHNNAGRLVVRMIPDYLESRETISKHDSLYFDDGNIVLLSLPNDNVITAFKLYKDFLIVHSPVFRDMFSLPSPQKRDQYDNVPYVCLQDEAVQLIPFLNSIYDFWALPSKRDCYFSLDKVESIFALSMKYQCENLLNYMRNTLSAVWPKNLEAWDRNLDESPIRAAELLEDYILRSTLPEPCSAIRLARDYDVPEILPTAFYHLFRIYSPDSETIPHNESSSVIFDHQPNLMHLSNHDLVRLLRGTCGIRRFMNDTNFRAFQPVYKCGEKQQQRKCSDALLQIMRVHCYHGSLRCYDPLSLLDPRKTVNDGKSQMCFLCKKDFTERLTKHRSELWNSFPGFFGVERPSESSAYL